MKVKRYIVSWHEENESGVPVHVMGAEVFKTMAEAKAWVDNSVGEDRYRHENIEGLKPEFLDETVDDGIVHTHGNGQHTMYNISEVEMGVDDDVLGFVDELKAICHRKLDSSAKYIMISQAVVDFERKVRPKRKFSVDVSFRPMVCVHGIEATTKEEAEDIVENMIDDRTLKVNADEIMDTLLENVESVGDAEEET